MTSARPTFVFALLLAALVVRAADVAPALPSQDLELSLDGAGPYYTLKLPMAVQSRAASSELRDLQVVNARGEVLPFAWVEALPGTSEKHHQAVPIFKLPGAASGGRTAPPRSWMLDVRRVSGTLLRLDLAFPDSARGVYTLSVETSQDLQQWRMLQPSVQVLSLEHQAQRLASTGIDLGGVAAGYLRLTALPGSHLPELQSAQVTSVREQAMPRPVQWSEPIVASACGPRHCDYPLPKNVPLEQMQVQLAEANTFAKVQMLGEMDVTVPPEMYRQHGLKHRLKALREKSELVPTNNVSTVWVPLGTANVYWLRPLEGEARSGPQWLDSGLYSVLRLQTNGPIAQLGPTPPTLRVGARTPTLVFLTRGPGPFRLAWMDPQTAQAAMPLAQLIPTRKVTDALPTDTATIVVPMPATTKVPMTRATAASANAAPSGNKPVWLCVVLLGGLAAMGFMAQSLLRRPNSPSL